MNLVESEARTQSTDAGRVSCARPYEAWMRAASLWREHARRSGSQDSLQRAEQAGRDASRAAQTDDQAMRAAIDVGNTCMLAFDLYGAPYRLNGLLESMKRLPEARNPETRAELLALTARLKARQARIAQDATAMTEAANLLAAAMQDIRPSDNHIVEDLALDRAALSLEAGLLSRDAQLLDRAGRELRVLVEGASPDERPVSRARALALCGTGMSALAAVAVNDDAGDQASTLYDAAADQFTADHSPLDWASIVLLKAESGPVKLSVLAQAQRLTDRPGLILGAMIRERLMAQSIAEADANEDIPALTRLESQLRKRLSSPPDDATAVEWASDQISLTRLVMVLSSHLTYPTADLGMALFEAADAANLAGAPALAKRARDLMLAAKSL
ncbi:hypothetical protein [uncultured Brevundimonas sp.]|uniref:hypothetical protein n=1 Tax=uncultured Brevundimonas sp. TaxID=213418 RepID=UPI00262B52C7|nr:hypothetical protein [uncultured Brevundimonas sp.]